MYESYKESLEKRYKRYCKLTGIFLLNCCMAQCNKTNFQGMYFHYTGSSTVDVLRHMAKRTETVLCLISPVIALEDPAES